MQVRPAQHRGVPRARRALALPEYQKCVDPRIRTHRGVRRDQGPRRRSATIWSSTPSAATRDLRSTTASRCSRASGVRVPRHGVPGHPRVQSGRLLLRQVVQDAGAAQLRPGHQELRLRAGHRARAVRRHRLRARVVRQGARAHRRRGGAVRPARPGRAPLPQRRRRIVFQSCVRAGQVRRRTSSGSTP